MDFRLTAHHRELRTSVRELLAREAPPETVTRLDDDERYPAELYASVAGRGLCGVTIPAEYGGHPEDDIGLCLIAEEIGLASGALVYAYMPTVMFAAPCVVRYGSEVQKQQLLPPIARGELRIALGLTEPDAGSDITQLSTSAARDGNDLIVRGCKTMVAGADTADYLLTFLVTGNGTGVTGRGPTAVLLPIGARGVSCRTLGTLAAQATHLCEVTLDDVRIGLADVVGQTGDGRRIVGDLLDRDRVMFAAQSCGIARGAFELARLHAAEHREAGEPKAESQSVVALLADMAMDLEAARLVTLQAAWKLGQGLPASTDAAMAKVFSSEAASRCVDRGFQILGDHATLVEAGMERYYRECKVKEIAGGTNQILRTQIIRRLGRARPENDQRRC
jgi:alkylation response protein AidB-like acyl-CoA dehydrogenase